MTQKEKSLLLKDLCARLPYGVICQIYDPQQDYCEDIFDARLIHIDAWTSNCYFWGCSETDPYKIEQIKPYLRPMSSIASLISAKEWTSLSGIDLIDWYNSHYIDYRGLIEKGLAIEAPEGMYE